MVVQYVEHMIVNIGILKICIVTNYVITDCKCVDL